MITFRGFTLKIETGWARVVKSICETRNVNDVCTYGLYFQVYKSIISVQKKTKHPGHIWTLTVLQ